MPQTGLGRLSARLLLTAAVGSAVFFSFVASGEKGGDTFFSNPRLATSVLAAAVLAVAAGAVAGVAIVRHRERSPLAFAIAVVGALVAAYAIAEVSIPH